jgi:hypothetical protein
MSASSHSVQKPVDGKDAASSNMGTGASSLNFGFLRESTTHAEATACQSSRGSLWFIVTQHGASGR